LGKKPELGARCGAGHAENEVSRGCCGSITDVDNSTERGLVVTGVSVSVLVAELSWAEDNTEVPARSTIARRTAPLQGRRCPVICTDILDMISPLFSMTGRQVEGLT
jgi:hypothetical protein